MSAINTLIPRQPVPSLAVSTVGGGTWSLAERTPENFTLVVFFRGLHCPICGRYLADLERKLDDFTAKGVDVVAITSDSQERIEQAKQDWKLDRLTLGYGLDLEKAREWGLFISTGRGKTSIGVEEPALFSEPGLFLIQPDGTLYFSSVQTMPFVRPNFAEVVKSLEFVIDKNYPARGQVVDHKQPQAA